MSTLAYACSALLAIALVAALIAGLGWFLDRVCGLRYDETSTSPTGWTRQPSTSPDMARAPWWSQTPVLLNAEPRPLSRPTCPGGDPR